LEIRIEETLTRCTNDNARQFFHRAFSIEKNEGVEDVQKMFPN
jgi:hypothetical protein